MRDEATKREELEASRQAVIVELQKAEQEELEANEEKAALMAVALRAEVQALADARKEQAIAETARIEAEQEEKKSS